MTRHLILIPGIAASLAACTATTSPVDIEGVYQLVELNGEPLPYDDQPHGCWMLSAREVAARLGMSEAWVYRHANALPFAKKYPTGAARFSSKGLDRWLSRRT